MKNIRIEEVGDITSNFPYLEVFLNGNKSPFLEIGISTEKQLFFKFYTTNIDVFINVEEWDYIDRVSKDFLPRVIKNENYFSDFSNQL